MAPPLGTPELQKELADIARRIVENGKVSQILKPREEKLIRPKLSKFGN